MAHSAPQAARAQPVHRQTYRWSRRTGQSAGGYYTQALDLCEDYPQQDRTQARIDQDLAIVRWSGAKALRFGISWLDVEPKPGQYDWSFWDRFIATAAKDKIALIPYVCYTPYWAATNTAHAWRQPPKPGEFAKFMAVIARRYRGKVYSWELWNEPDNPDFWLGSASQYAQMVVGAASAVRNADPHAEIVLGGMADGRLPFLKTLIDQYAIDRVVDAINLHGYYQTWNSHPVEDYTSLIDLAHSELSARPRADLWFAEFGYSSLRPSDPATAPDPTFYPYEHTIDYQAIVLLKTQLIALATGRVSLSAWYRIRDLAPGTQVIGGDNNMYFGIAYADGTLKPAAYSLRFYNRMFDKPTRCIDSEAHVTQTGGNQAQVHVFEQRGRIIVTAWLRTTLYGEIKDMSGNALDTRAETVAVTLPVQTGTTWRYYSPSGAALRTSAHGSGHTLSGIALRGGSLFIAIGTRQIGAVPHHRII